MCLVGFAFSMFLSKVSVIVLGLEMYRIDQLVGCVKIVCCVLTCERQLLRWRARRPHLDQPSQSQVHLGRHAAVGNLAGPKHVPHGRLSIGPLTLI